MRIGIDIRPLGQRKTGIGRYLDKLLEALPIVDSRNEYVLFYNALKGSSPAKNERFEIRQSRWPNKVLSRLWAHTSFPAIEKLMGPVDVFHAPNYQMPPSKIAAKVLTIHDLVFLTHPEIAAPATVKDYGPWIEHYARRADIIVADSNATASDITDRLGISPQKIMTVYPGATILPNADNQLIQKTKAGFDIKGNYILCVSNVEPRKNLARLFLAFNQSGLASDFELILVGPKGWNTEKIYQAWQSLPCKDRIRWLDFVGDDALSSLYSGATFLAYPSIMEGFGLPILEAMSAGCPILTSNVSSMPEVAGDAAVYVDPLEIDSIAQGLRRISGDSGLRKNLSCLGIKRAAEFTWESTARRMIEVYEMANNMRDGH